MQQRFLKKILVELHNTGNLGTEEPQDKVPQKHFCFYGVKISCTFYVML